MVSNFEVKERLKDFFRFDKSEISSLLIATLVTAFIFSFNDWGDQVFNLTVGLINFIQALICIALTFAIRFSLQKWYALKEGYTANFKPWWTGLLIAVVINFLSLGKIPLVIIGAVVCSFMVKQRLGEYRYGFNLKDAGSVALWGIIGNLILAILFATGSYLFPENYFFNLGLWANIIMAFTSLFPIPQLDGFNIFFGSRLIYFISIFMVVGAAALLLSRNKTGLIITIVVGTIIGIAMSLFESKE